MIPVVGSADPLPGDPWSRLIRSGAATLAPLTLARASVKDESA